MEGNNGINNEEIGCGGARKRDDGNAPSNDSHRRGKEKKSRGVNLQGALKVYHDRQPDGSGKDRKGNGGYDTDPGVVGSSHSREKKSKRGSRKNKHYGFIDGPGECSANDNSGYSTDPGGSRRRGKQKKGRITTKDYSSIDGPGGEISQLGKVDGAHKDSDYQAAFESGGWTWNYNGSSNNREVSVQGRLMQSLTANSSNISNRKVLWNKGPTYKQRFIGVFGSHAYSFMQFVSGNSTQCTQPICSPSGVPESHEDIIEGGITKKAGDVRRKIREYPQKEKNPQVSSESSGIDGITVGNVAKQVRKFSQQEKTEKGNPGASHIATGAEGSSSSKGGTKVKNSQTSADEQSNGQSGATKKFVVKRTKKTGFLPTALSNATRSNQLNTSRKETSI